MARRAKDKKTPELEPKRAKGTADPTTAGASKRRGRPLGSRNKPDKPGKVLAVGVDVPRLTGLLRPPGELEDTEPFGRPPKYQPHFAEIARGMALMGAGDFEIAEELGVTTQTIWRWRAKHPDFCYALDHGKDAFDNRIERSLAMRASGYSIHTEKVFQYEGCIVRANIVEHFPPDVGAIKLWLGNRRPDKWKDKQEVKLDGSEAFLKIWQAISDGAA